MRSLIIMSIAMMPILTAQQIHTTMTRTGVPRRIGVPKPGLQDAIVRGHYLITSAHSGLAVGFQQFGGEKELSESVSDVRWEIIPEGLGYQIRGEHGYLTEVDPGRVYLSVGKGDPWSIATVAGSDTVELIAPSGRALESNWRVLPGSWISLTKRTGASNQEWHVSAASGMRVLQRANVATIRADKRSDRASLDMLPVEDTPEVIWSPNGANFMYRLIVHNEQTRRVSLDNVGDFVSMGAPAGFTFHGGAWESEVIRGRGSFWVASSYAPGPMLIRLHSTPSTLDPVIAEPGDSVYQWEQKMLAAAGRGSHYWVIGPSLPPAADDAKLRAIVQGWVNNGMGFAWPLLDTSKPFRDQVSSLKPTNELERRAMECLIAYFGGAK